MAKRVGKGSEQDMVYYLSEKLEAKHSKLKAFIQIQINVELKCLSMA